MNYDIESIVIKVLANNSGNLIIPLKGYSTSGRTNCPYDWKITVDDGAETSYSGTGGGTLTIGTGLVAGSEHLVVIKPTTVAYQRARAFGTDSGDEGPYISEIVQDSTYMGYGVSATDTGGYFRYTQYSNCTEIVKAPEEVMPDTVTTIGYGFRLGQYWNAQKLVKAPKEVMSNNVTTIGNDFRAYLYQDSILLDECPEEYLSESLISIGNGFRCGIFYDCINIKNVVEECLPDGVQTIGDNFRYVQYKGTRITKTAKEVMPDSIITIGKGCRNNQYYDCKALKEIVGEIEIKNATIGNNYRLSMYAGCVNLVKAKLAARNGGTGYRSNCFYATTNPMTITILGDVVDAPAANSGGLTDASISKIYVDSNLVSGYQSSAKWSNISDSKFIAIPSVDGVMDMLLFNDVQNVLLGTKIIGTGKLIFNGTENRVWDSGNNRVTLSLTNTSTLYAGVTCTHGPSHPNNSSVKDDGWCTYNLILCCYTTKATLQDFKDWLAQEYVDGTPVIVNYMLGGMSTVNIPAIDFDTRDGENLIEIIESGPDADKLRMDIVADVAAGGYQSYMFNGVDYSKEEDWVEISDTQLVDKQDKITSSNKLNADLVDDSNSDNKFVTSSDINNWNNKQDSLTAGNGIDINASNKISTTYIYGESSTAAATVQKEVSIPSITELNVGQVIIVKPTVTSTVANSTLKLNDFPAYTMIYNGSAITTSTDSIVWTAYVPSMFLLDTLNDTYCWRFLGHGLDSNSTYTLNQLLDAGRYEAGTGTYAITRYSLCMMKPDGTWEKITATNATYSTGTSKTVNTNGFVLNQIKYYNTTTTVAGGAFVATNAFTSQAATVTLAYSFNCGTAPGWAVGDPIYIVGTIGVDGLFYLDTTARWSTTLPSTNDGKLYIRIGTALAADNSTASFLQDRPIFYYDNGIRAYLAADNKQDVISDLATIRSGAAAGATAIQPNDNISELTNDAGYITSAPVTSVNNQTGDVVLTIPTTASDVGALPNTTKYGAALTLEINSSTYVVTATLKDQDGNTLGTAQTIDLPLESVVVSGSYDDTTKKIILTLQSGSTVEFSVADLVAGLQSEITSTNKLSSDLVDDTNHINKFVTAAEKTKLSNLSGTNTGDETGTTIKTKLGAASSSQDGYLTSTDWSTFNNKQNAISDLAAIRSGAEAGATALQPGDNISVLSNDAGYLTSNTGVTSVNGQTGDVTITSGGIQTLPGSPVTQNYVWIGSEQEYEALATHRTDTEYKIY